MAHLYEPIAPLLPGDRNTYGLCVDPFVLHIAGTKSKDAVNASIEKMRALVGVRQISTH